MRNCTRDEGGPFEVGNHGPIASRCKLLRSKAVVVSVAVKLGPKIQDGKVERGERKRTAAEASKADFAGPCHDVDSARHLSSLKIWSWTRLPRLAPMSLVSSFSR
jgi:hypothetical protein